MKINKQKKFVAAGLLVAIICSSFMVNTPVTAAEVSSVTKEIYVSGSGNDSDAGTKDAPIKTLERAQELVRENNDGSCDILVTVMEGTYYLDKTLIFTNEDGGRNGSSVTWQGTGEVIISGNQTIEGWKIYDKQEHIYYASVPEDFDTRQLYVNGEKALRSRSIAYGNNSYEHLDRTCELGLAARNNKEFYFYEDEVDDWENFEDVEFHILTAWTENILRLKKYDDNMNFKPVTINNGGSEGNVAAVAVKVQEPESERMFNRPHPDITGSTRGYASRSYYYFENAYEFIDEAYEWYLDKTEDIICFKAPEDMDVEKVKFEVPVLETLISVCGTAKEPIQNLTFKNLTIEGSTWLRPSQEGLVGGQACQYVLTSTLDNALTLYRPPSAFYVKYAKNIDLDSCCFKNIGATAVDFFCGVSDSTIQKCEVYEVAGNGISVAKFVQDENTEMHEAYNPADEREICKDVMIVNNEVHDIGTEMEGAVAIAAGYPENIIIAYNEIYNAPYSGISVGFGWTNKDNTMKNNVIFRNRIYDIGLVLCDFGGIYTLSKQPDSLCAGNYISDVSTKSWFDYGYAAMYFDEQTAGYLIKDNVLFNIGNEAWGGGINFNGCADKNTTKDNINIDGNLTPEAEVIAEKAGINTKNCEEIKEDIEQYKYELKNPVEPYDASDYRVESEIIPYDAWAEGDCGNADAFYAIDGDSKTTFYVEGQTESSMKEQYLIVELDGESPISRVEIQRQFNAAGMTGDNTYWADWCLAVGCEIQGSFDGEKWETIGTMNTWPDNTGELDKETLNIKDPKPYKFIRYIRTKYKSGGDYAVWRWADTDGGNRLNVQDIKFYTYKDAYKVKVKNISATGCDANSKPEYAVDGDHKTAYTVSGQTADSIDKEYLLLETDGLQKIERIIIRRQYNAGGMTDENSYWADWCLAVGCEVQGSYDGEEWKTIGVMNTFPDGTGETPKEIINIENPEAYKYIRYIRTKYKSDGDYAVWRWADSDGGNRLNVKEIELYTSELMLPYEDVAEDSWYYDAVYYNYIAGTMTGKSDTTFAPDESLARGQFASILYRIEGSPEVEFKPEFADVEKDIWYTAPILWAKSEGIVNGYSNGNFGPGDMITREQMAIMMYNYAVSKGYDVSETNNLAAFKDAASVSEYAIEEVQWAVGAGIISGKENGTILDPQGETARAQCAVIIMNFMEKYAK